jgi:hypothetical protein
MEDRVRTILSKRHPGRGLKHFASSSHGDKSDQEGDGGERLPVAKLIATRPSHRFVEGDRFFFNV